MQNLTIYLGAEKIESNKFLFCHKQIIISDLITEKSDHLIILTTILQLKLLKEANIIFIDATFVFALNNIIKY